jgi:hypothetical protein
MIEMDHGEMKRRFDLWADKNSYIQNMLFLAPYLKVSNKHFYPRISAKSSSSSSSHLLLG